MLPGVRHLFEHLNFCSTEKVRRLILSLGEHLC